MRLIVGVTLFCLSIAGAAEAAPRKTLVLPLDGNTDPTVRVRLNGVVRRQAAKLEGTVITGDTTFSETAAAVGCDPHTPTCVDEVIATLGVDELVWGTANTQSGQTVVVVRRATKKTPWRESSAAFSTADPPERAEPQLGELFVTAPRPMVGVPPPIGVTPPPLFGSVEDNHERNLGIAFAAGGGLIAIVGFVVWVNQRSTQGEVVGDVLMLGGLGLGGYGGYVLYKDRERRLSVRPTPMANGVGVGVALELVMP